MRRFCRHLGRRSIGPWQIGFLVFLMFIILSLESARALTASLGQPYHGRLKNGIPFPAQFRGYQLREVNTYTTPEVVGALLDAIEAVRQQYQNSCDLYLGDFSPEGGGWISHHRSHQNGRDVDIGMYAKDNRPLSTFAPMTEENLDVPKTWCLMEGLLRSQRIQYIFLDRRVQRLLYDYALSHGVDQGYLDRLFGDSRGSIVQHVARHQDHMHVRFFTPWSTLAGQMGGMDDPKRAVIEMAQQAYLPKKVVYYAKGTERGMDALAKSFGVNRKDLCQWNNMQGNEVLTPGSCLVFYKRGFEMEPVHLAQSIVPDSIPDTVRFASLGSPKTLSDVAPAIRSSNAKEKKGDSPVIITCTVRRGDTLDRIAKRNGMELKTLCELNRMKSNTSLRPGQKIKLVSVKPSHMLVHGKGSEFDRPGIIRSSKSGSDSKHAISAEDTYIVKKWDTPAKIAKSKGIALEDLCRMNGLKKNTALKPGHKIKLASVKTSPTSPTTKKDSAADKNHTVKSSKSSAPRTAVSGNSRSAKKVASSTTSRASKASSSTSVSSSSKSVSSKSQIKEDKNSKKSIAKDKKGSSKAQALKGKKNLS